MAPTVTPTGLYVAARVIVAIWERSPHSAVHRVLLEQHRNGTSTFWQAGLKLVLHSDGVRSTCLTRRSRLLLCRARTGKAVTCSSR